MAKAGSTAVLFGGTVNSQDVLYKVSSGGILPGDKCKILFFDKGKCNLFHLSSQMLMHGSFLAVLAGLHFQDSSQATACGSISSPAHPLWVSHTCLHCKLTPSCFFQVAFPLELALLQDKCHSLKKYISCFKITHFLLLS